MQERGGASLPLDPCRRTPSLGRASSYVPWILKPPLLPGQRYYTYMQIVGPRVMSGFSLSRLFLSSWASLNSRLYKETHRLEAVAKYLPSFTFVIVTEMEGEFFNVFFFNRRTCSRRRLVFGLRGIPFAPLAVVWINDTPNLGSTTLFFLPSFKINNTPTRTSSDIYAIKKKKKVFVFPHFLCHAIH